MTLSRSARLAILTVLAAGLGALVLVLGSPARSAPAATDLFLSEYVEGSGNTKALELYNGTGAPVTLTGTYSIQLFSNGGATPSSEIALTGTVADGDVFVLARSTAAAAVLAQADQTTTNFLFVYPLPWPGQAR